MAGPQRPLLLKPDYQALLSTLETLTEDLKKWAKSSTEVGGVGDWHDNFAHEESMRQMALISKRIHDLTELSRSAQVMDEADLTHHLQRISIGRMVTIVDEQENQKKYYLGSHTRFRQESEIEGYMIISYVSPLGRALVGKELGDEITVTIAGRPCRYSIIEVR